MLDLYLISCSFISIYRSNLFRSHHVFSVSICHSRDAYKLIRCFGHVC
uniref:Uncharacterized protein n=1 Tax=Anguilla anguilla TaxID=7936 RepID=A0A0E9QIG6_ANGAN